MNATPAISDALISDRTVPAGPNYRVFSDAVFRAAIANALRLKDERIQVSDGGRVVAEYFYFTRGGQPFRPSYLYDAAQVETKEAGSSASRNAHWIRRCQAFAGHLRDGGIRTINLDPSFSDVRPFLWQGFLASPVYSICLTRESQLESSAKKEIKKALRSGYTCEKASHINSRELFECLRSTEVRQNLRGTFSNTFTVEALDQLQLSPNLHFYVCKTSDTIAAFRIVIQNGSDTAHDWLAAVQSSHLDHGVSDFLLNYVSIDLFRSGCEYFDLHGANVPSIQSFKFKHGGVLVQSFQVSTRAGFLFRTLKTLVAEWLLKIPAVLRRGPEVVR